MITWGDVVDIILYTFDLKQIDLAILLNCDSSKISKIRSGAQPLSLPLRDKLFPLVFDPDEDNSPAQKLKGDSKFWLGTLKENIASQFKEVQKDMDDCWEGNDYREFVLTMLRRTRKGPSSKNCPEKKKGVSLGETPAEQMSKIFEQAVADYNIAVYICKLPDYLNGETFYAGDIKEFIDTIQREILGKFVNQQNEDIYRKISEFGLALETYSGCLTMIRLSVVEYYGSMWKMLESYAEIFDEVNRDYSKVKIELYEKRSIGKNTQHESAMVQLETKLNQLDFLRSILLAYKQICGLFSEICSGRTLLVF